MFYKEGQLCLLLITPLHNGDKTMEVLIRLPAMVTFKTVESYLQDRRKLSSRPQKVTLQGRRKQSGWSGLGLTTISLAR